MLRFLTVSSLIILIFSLNIFSQSRSRPSPSRGIPRVISNTGGPNISHRRRNKISNERVKLVKAFKKIRKEDKEKYKNFLRQSNTGIFHLMPDFDCETRHIIRTNGDCKGFIPGLWAYSIRRKTYSNESFQDLSFKKDNLVSDGFLTQSLMVDLGKQNLSNVSVDDSALTYLVDFIPETELNLIKSQFTNISKGINKNNYFYSNRLKLKLNNIYALRVIAYKFKDKKFRRFRSITIKQNPREIRSFLNSKYDKRNDSVYIFKVVKKASKSYAITILWKRLAKQKSPTIVYEKTEELKDFKTKK